MKVLFPELALILVVMLLGCSPQKRTAVIEPHVSFLNVEWRLVGGKINDSTFKFSDAPDEILIVKYNGKKFRVFDGSFTIKSAVKDSLYGSPYTGFYKVKDGNLISMQWFSKISWKFGFEKSKIGKTIAELFSQELIYEHDRNSLVFFKSKNNERDTAIIMELNTP